MVEIAMRSVLLKPLALLLLAQTVCASRSYTLNVLSINPLPVLSYVDGSSAFQQVFNPSYIVASPGTRGVEGLVLRTQNCNATVGGECVRCGGSGPEARYLILTCLICSILTFSRVLDGFPLPVTDRSVIFSPDPSITEEAFGTEDPRIAFDHATGM